ncbi:MAG TPA: alpha/beta hydrolase [Ktedonobacterales bacterium]|nr:alpha/beta hydrolase [Ktedonobacterales bacterium]
MASPPRAASDLSTQLAAAEEAYLRLAVPGLPIERCETTSGPLRLHYLTCGQGEPMLLLHGRGSSAARFAPILAQLAAERRVLALDLPGWGLSDKPPFTGRRAADALKVWVEGVRTLLDDQGIERVDLLGHSMGGFTALGFALDAPERVGRLVLVDPGGVGTQMQLDARLFFSLGPERLYRRFGKRLVRFIYARETAQLPAMHAADPAAAEAEIEFLYRLATQHGIVESGARAFNAWINLNGVHLDLGERLSELPMPVLLLWGMRDRVTPYANALHAVRHLRDGKLVTFVRCGHAPFAERPDDFIRVLLAWLAGIHVPSRA